MKKIVAIVGAANIDGDADKQALAFETGKLLVESGYIVATGGLGGVMEYASDGARAASNYAEGAIIGVLPGYDPHAANQHVDIAIPSGMGVGRNLLLVSMANAVIAIGGGAGTLSEIALAWQLRKLVIALQTPGWSGNLAGKPLDQRRDDYIFGAASAVEALNLLKRNIKRYAANQFNAVKPLRISRDSAAERIAAHSRDGVAGKLTYLGRGSEGLVFKDKQSIYKLIDTNPSPLQLHWQLSALAEQLRRSAPVECLPDIQAVTLCEHKQVLIQSAYLKSSDFFSASQCVRNVSAAEYIRLLKALRRIGWVCADLNPKNLRILASGALLLADIGHSLFPFSQPLYMSMCRRVFVIHKLQTRMADAAEFKPYLTAVNERADFSKMTQLDFNQQDLAHEFEQFYCKAATFTKDEVLNPILSAVFSANIAAKTVLDYGSGHGDHAQMLTRLGMRVTAYEPDQETVAKHRRRYADVDIVSHAALVKMTTDGAGDGAGFDAVLCSLVLCHPLAPSAQQQLAEINKIMDDLTALARKHLVIVICNPLYTGQPASQLQRRRIADDFSYYHQTPYCKTLFSTSREMPHIHRPLGFYEELFRKRQLEIRQIVQTADATQPASAQNSDFMIFVLAKN